MRVKEIGTQFNVVIVDYKIMYFDVDDRMYILNV